MKFHPACERWPLIPEGPARDAFDADIREHGVRIPALTFKGRIVDGRNRWLACQRLGIECPTRELNTEEDAIEALVVSYNLHRRHLEPDARSAMVCVLAPHLKAKAVPTWYRKLSRWEHGFDYSLLAEYRDVEMRTGCDVWIAVNETKSPPDPNADCKPSDLLDGDLWLVISLTRAAALGEHRREWPKRFPGDRGRRGQGGLLWPRSAMDPLR